MQKQNKERVMLSDIKLVGLVLAASLWGCAPPAKIAETASVGAPSRIPKSKIYDFTDFDYIYVRTYALRSTNLEPSPTSYVLFQPEPLDESVTAATDESLRVIQEKLSQHVARIKAYCLEHEIQFDTLVGAYESDPFVNTVCSISDSTR